MFGLSGAELLVLIPALGVAGGLYGLPTILAFLRRHPQRVRITVLNLTLGWTVLGWVAAAIWTLAPRR